MQGKLQLHEDVGSGALPWLSIAKITAISSVIIDLRRSDSGRAMIFSRMEESDAIDAKLLGIEDIAHGLLPTAPIRFCRSKLDHLRKLYCTLGAMGLCSSAIGRVSNGPGVNCEMLDITGKKTSR